MIRPRQSHVDEEFAEIAAVHEDVRFKLPPAQPDPRRWLDALFEAGCGDATIGVGRLGFIALDFARNAPTREEALLTAISDVKRVIPGCIEAD